jgi:hypothetical protein
MKKNFYFYSNLFAWGLVLLLITNYVYGWTIPSQDPPGGNIVLETGATPAGSTGYIQFNDNGNLGADSNLFWDNTNKYLGIGTASPGAELEVAGTILTNRESIAYYQNVIHKVGSSSELGTLKITMPKSWTNTMMKIRIEGFNYSGNSRGTSWSVVVGGYNYATTPGWYNYFAEINGSAPFNIVRLGHDRTSNVLLLGTTSTAWSYPKIVVAEFMAGHGIITGWGEGWNISWITTESSITNIVTPVIDLFKSSSGNVGIGTTSPGEKLEVSGNIKLSGASPTYKITNLAEPTADSDAATKGYVDALGGGDGFNLCTIHSYSNRYNNNFLSCSSGWNTFYNKTSYGCNTSGLVTGSINIGSSTTFKVNMYYPINSNEYMLTLGGQSVSPQCRNTRNNWNAYAQVLMCCTRNI